MTSERLTYPLDHGKTEALNFVLELIAGNHGVLSAASIWYDSTADRIKYVAANGTTVRDIPLPSEGGGDADTLGGQDGTYYRSRTNHTGTQALGTITGHDKAAHDALDIDAETLGGQLASYFLDRTNHSGSQLAATISNLAATVQAYRLDQFAAPTANVGLNSQKIINLSNGSSNGDAVNYGQLSSAVSGLAATTYVDNAISNLVNGAGAALDTLNELATALGNDANFATTVNTAIAARAKKFSANVGNGSATQIDIVHNYGTYDFAFDVFSNAAPRGRVRPGNSRPDVNTLRLNFNTAPTADQFRVVVLGG